MFTRIFSIGACGVLLLAAASGTAQDYVDFPSEETAIWPSLITVTGQGEVKARPEQATLRFGVEAQEQQAADAQSAVNQAMQRVIQSVKELQVPDRAIQTAGLNLSPVYSPRRPGQEQETPKIEPRANRGKPAQPPTGRSLRPWRRPQRNELLFSSCQLLMIWGETPIEPAKGLAEVSVTEIQSRKTRIEIL